MNDSGGGSTTRSADGENRRCWSRIRMQAAPAVGRTRLGAGAFVFDLRGRATQLFRPNRSAGRTQIRAGVSNQSTNDR
jgi:hypothetical protein